MPGLHKMNRAGLQYLRNLFNENPNMPFAQMLPIYNNEAVKRGWRCLRSSGTIAYHLTTMGLYEYGERAVSNNDFGHKLIKVSVNVKKEIAKIFSVSNIAVWDALNFRTQSQKAKDIRAWALNHGGKLFEEAENPYEKVITL